jgi:Ca2+-binding RTX toxin-like protein
VLNCEDVKRLHGTNRVPGRIWRDNFGDDVWDDSQGHFRDILVGLGGDDYLNGHALGDFVWGNEGDDRLDGDLSPDFVLGGPGDDQLWGRAGLDRLWGGAGFDEIYGGPGDDELISITADNRADMLDCGEHAGDRDRAIVRTGDTVSGCERVIRIPG